VESWEGFEWMITYAGRNGFPEKQLQTAIDAHPGSKFGSGWIPDLKILEDGEKIEYGDFSFTCIATPGHTMGHTCLYETDKKILISGDHILIDITPNIQCWSDERNPLKDYLLSLRKVYDLDVELVLPGHRRIFLDHRRRIRELEAHHRHRLEEVLGILKNADLTAYDTAARMSWDIKADCWDAFPIAQKWFATGEALSHLLYLEKEGMLRRETVDGKVRFAVSRQV
jgi:glyoxylase-like metal-dependent hydrolase (beta-lactamase superfamily II)